MTLNSTNQCARNIPRGFSNMADISFFEDESDGNINDEYGLGDGLGEENLSLPQQLEKYMDSDIILNRQTVAQCMLETLQAAGENKDACMEILNNMAHLSQDPEALVRCDLMEQIHHVAVYCHERTWLFGDVIPTYIVPIVVRYLSDINTQVRKTAQAVLLEMLKKQLMEKEDIEEQVIGVVLELASPDSHDDYRTEAVALMSRMAPMLGQDITERHFLPRFCQLLADPLFHVRKVCASYFGEVCNVVGKQNSEQILLPKLNSLCGDGVWGVRKACAECFTTISSTCSPRTRRSYLANLFVDLLADQSRWVRMSAFQQLGPFISTFADSHETTEDGSDNDNEEPLTVVETSEERSRLSPSPEENGGEVIGCGCKQSEKMDVAHLDQDVRGGDGKENGASMLQDQSRVHPLDENLDLKPCEEQQCCIEHSNNSTESRVPSLSSKEEENPLENSVPSGMDELVCLERESEDAASNDNSANCDTCANIDFHSAVADSQDPANSFAETGSNDVASNLSVNMSDTTTALPSADSDHQVPTATDSNFDTFQYWRLPIPTVDIDLDVINAAPDSIHVVAMAEKEEQDMASSPADVIMSTDEGSMEPLLTDTTFLSITDFSNLNICAASAEEADEVIRNIGGFNLMNDSLENFDMDIEEEEEEVNKDTMDDSLGYMDADLALPQQDIILARKQDIVPQSLLENYLGMVEPSRAQTVDSEIATHCAYNLPAVAYTLGRENWHCIKNLYETLARTPQWKVRQTLALSIHEMAIIEGEEITHRDLVPIFEVFLEDVDEVRIGLLKHLAVFFKMMQPDMRKRHLPALQVYLNLDPRKWRIRHDLAEQLVLLCDLYDAMAIIHHIAPMALGLLRDKVAFVRSMARKLMSTVIRRLHEDGLDKPLRALCADLTNDFAVNFTWLPRQMYCQVCKVVLEERSLPQSLFSTLLLPGLLTLAKDPVANVRSNVASVLTQYTVLKDEFISALNPGLENVKRTVQSLQSDKDRDVRFCSRLDDRCISDANTKLLHDNDTVPV